MPDTPCARLADLPLRRGLSPAGDAIAGAMIAEGCCPRCADGRLADAGVLCPVCCNPLHTCPSCGSSFWSGGRIDADGPSGGWGEVTADGTRPDTPDVDDAELALWIAGRLGVDVGMVSRVLAAELDYISMLKIGGPAG